MRTVLKPSWVVLPHWFVFRADRISGSTSTVNRVFRLIKQRRLQVTFARFR